MRSFAEKIFAAAFLLGCVLAGSAVAQRVTPPPTPTDITPPVGNSAFLVGHAQGTQGYTCLPTSTGGAAWNVSPRPEATLFTNIFGQPVQIITHFASINTHPHDNGIPVPLSGNATWQSSFDTSKLWATKVGQIDAGNDPASCPNTGSIPCLLLQSVGNQQGPTGGRLLAKATFVQRLNTDGGATPADGCSVASDVGSTRLVPYTADYYFYQADKQ